MDPEKLDDFFKIKRELDISRRETERLQLRYNMLGDQLLHRLERPRYRPLFSVADEQRLRRDIEKMRRELMTERILSKHLNKDSISEILRRAT